MKVYRAKRASVALLSGLLLFILTGSIFGQNVFRKMNDYDGDGKSDFAVVRSDVLGNKVWYIWRSRDGFLAFQWGRGGDMLAPGDFDGDGKTDITVFRPTNAPPLIHYFWVWRSATNDASPIGTVGIPALAPVQQDYNGDGVTDPAIWIGSFIEPPNSTPTNLSVQYTTGGGANLQLPPGISPRRAGDLTGDGRADGVFISGGISVTDFVTNTTNIVSPPISGQLVTGDFDGDGKGDLAAWRASDGMWGWVRSSDNTVQLFQWGMLGDRPIAGDFDGDGKTDPAIWRPGSGQAYYWVYGSQNSSVTVMPWGLSTDTLVEP